MRAERDPAAVARAVLIANRAAGTCADAGATVQTRRKAFQGDRMTRSTFMTGMLAVVLAGCANGLVVGMSNSDVSVQLPGAPEKAMQVAREQITAHGYTIGGTSGSAKDGSFVTTPRPVPANEQPAGTTDPQLYVLQVNTGAGGSLGGSTVRIIGYRVPARPVAGASAGQAGVPVTTADKALFEEVRNAARWVRDAAKR